MRTDGIGLYVHIPFCVRKCNYCDFCSYAGLAAQQRRAYLTALKREAENYRGIGRKVDTVFIGGGTPSLLTPEEFEFVNDSLHSVFEIEEKAEYTVEANPKTVTREKVRMWQKCGVNRVSVGVQSAHENELAALGRIHTYADFRETVKLLRDGGIRRMNADIMYAIPEQTPATFRETLRRVMDESPEHISAYSLMIEEGTEFYAERDRLPLPGEEAEMEMMRDLCRITAQAGYEHYEISNFAKPGEACRHNLHYWRDEEYIGLGIAAHSCFGGKRFGNGRDITLYNKGRIQRTEEERTVQSRRFEKAMLALRLKEGLDMKEYEAEFGEAFLTAERRELTERLEAMGLAERTGERMRLTEKGFAVSNEILAELL